MATFKSGKCHHRDSDGNPDCTKPIVRPSANLCEAHEEQYQRGEYRARVNGGYGHMVAAKSVSRKRARKVAPARPSRVKAAVASRSKSRARSGRKVSHKAA